MSEWSADGMNVIVLHELMQHRLKTELFSVAMKHIYIYIYTMIGVCEQDQRERDQRERDQRERDKRERDKREKTGIKSVRLEDCFRLHRNQQHYTLHNRCELSPGARDLSRSSANNDIKLSINTT